MPATDEPYRRNIPPWEVFEEPGSVGSTSRWLIRQYRLKHGEKRAASIPARVPNSGPIVEPDLLP